MLFIISAVYYNYRPDYYNLYRFETIVVCQDYAYELGQKFMDAVNVLSVNIIDAMTFAQRCSTGRKHHWRNKYIVVDNTTGEVIIIFRCGFGLLQ